MNQEVVPMDPRRIQLAMCWVALALIYLLGDVLRLYEKGQAAAVIDGKPMTQTHLMMAALLMLVPILMSLGVIFLPKTLARWTGIIAAAALCIINIFGVGSYSGPFDRVLIGLSIVLNIFTVLWTWLW